MSWCCLTSGDERSAIKIEGYARNDDAREALSNSAALLIIMRCTNTFEPVEPAEPLSQIIKGQHAPWANPEP